MWWQTIILLQVLSACSTFIEDVTRCCVTYRQCGPFHVGYFPSTWTEICCAWTWLQYSFTGAIAYSVPVFQITTAVVLGVYLTNTLASADHVNHLLTIGNQRLFLLSQLKNRGLTLDSLHIIYLVLIQSKITYALPAFASQLSVMDLTHFVLLLARPNAVDLPKPCPQCSRP